VLVSGQKRVLYGIFSVMCVTHVAISPAIQRGQVSRNSFLKFPCALHAILDCVVILIPNVR